MSGLKVILILVFMILTIPIWVPTFFVTTGIILGIMFARALFE